MRVQENHLVDVRLQEWYRNMLAQPVPDRLAALVAGLDATSRNEKPMRPSRRVKRAKSETAGVCDAIPAFRPKRALAAAAVAP
jgi:hypothetical protein